METKKQVLIRVPRKRVIPESPECEEESDARVAETWRLAHESNALAQAYVRRPGAIIPRPY